MALCNPCDNHVTNSVYIFGQISLIDVWLRTDLAASWGKLVLALEEAGETIIAGRIKEEWLGILASAPVPQSALVPPRIGSECTANNTLCHSPIHNVYVQDYIYFENDF